MKQPLAGREFYGDRGIAEAIDALYRDSATPRDRYRLIELVKHQIRHTYYLGYREGQANAKVEAAA